MTSPRSALLFAAGAASLLGPAAAAYADVPVRVPARFLGGPIAEPLPTVSPLAVGVRSDDATRAGCGGPALDCLVLVADPDAIEEIPLPEPGPSSGIVGPDDDPDTPDGQMQASLARPDDAAEFGGLMTPAPGGWTRGRTPDLGWRTWPGAATYVVQVQRGPQLIASARTRGSSLRLPVRAIWMGRTFGWAVWALDAAGAPMNAGAPIGRSVFGVLPRLRAVFRPSPSGVRGEVRPYVPRGTLLVRLPGRAPIRVRLDSTSHFSLPVPVAQAERSRITLVARGPRAPLGLWR
jgi:hypothetical protein